MSKNDVVLYSPFDSRDDKEIFKKKIKEYGFRTVSAYYRAVVNDEVTFINSQEYKSFVNESEKFVNVCVKLVKNGYAGSEVGEDLVKLMKKNLLDHKERINKSTK